MRLVCLLRGLFSTYPVLSADAGRHGTFEFPRFPSATALGIITATGNSCQNLDPMTLFRALKLKLNHQIATKISGFSRMRCPASGNGPRQQASHPISKNKDSIFLFISNDAMSALGQKQTSVVTNVTRVWGQTRRLKHDTVSDIAADMIPLGMRQ